MREFENGCPCCGGTAGRHEINCGKHSEDEIIVTVTDRMTCDECGRYIPEDVEVYVQEIGGRKYYYCRDCLRKMTLSDLLEVLGVELNTARTEARKARGLA